MRKYFPFILQLFYSPLRDAAEAQNFLNDTKKQSFFLMTNIKMVLVSFVTPSGFDLASVTESLKRSFYFTVSDWDVSASCHCNGQASECDPDVSLLESDERAECTLSCTKTKTVLQQLRAIQKKTRMLVLS